MRSFGLRSPFPASVGPSCDYRTTSSQSHSLRRRIAFADRYRGCPPWRTRRSGEDCWGEWRVTLGITASRRANSLALRPDDNAGIPESVLTRDEMLDDIMKHWPPNAGAWSARFYREDADVTWGATRVDLPIAFSLFPKDLTGSSRRWAEARFGKIVYWRELTRGGRFAALEQPELFTEEVRGESLGRCGCSTDPECRIYPPSMLRARPEGSQDRPLSVPRGRRAPVKEIGKLRRDAVGCHPERLAQSCRSREPGHRFSCPQGGPLLRHSRSSRV